MKHDDTTIKAGSLNQLSIPKIQSITDPKRGSLGVSASLAMCVYEGNNVWAPAVDMGEDLFNFTSHVFTGAGSSTAAAPTLQQCLTAYSGLPFIGDLTLFTCEGGVQIWTVPASGTYRMVSQGGSNARSRGGGVDITAILEKGDKLRMIVGRSPISSYGGCGASVVYSDALGLLSVAAGAGGYAGSAAARNAVVNFVSGSGFGGSASLLGNIHSGTASTGGAGYLGDGAAPNISRSSATRIATRIDPNYPNCGTCGFGAGSSGSGDWKLGSTGGFGGGGGGGEHQGNRVACGGGAGYSGGTAASIYATSPSITAGPGTNFAAEGLTAASAFSPTSNDGQIEILRLL